MSAVDAGLAPDELVNHITDTLEPLEGHGEWRVVTGDKWDQAGRDGFATTYVEVVRRYPDSSIVEAEQRYLVAEPIASEVQS